MSASPGKHSFSQWKLKKEILEALSGMGITEPTEIQREVIPPMLEDKDVVGQSKTGTGKTAAFTVPVLQNLRLHEPRIQGLVLTPTRELAEQVGQEMIRIGKGLNVRVALIYGGRKYEGQIQMLRKGAHIVVGTPGRIIDLARRGLLDFSGIHYLVLDEADRMLDMGFLPDVEWILQQCPPREQRQTMFLSATIPETIRDLSRRFMNRPIFVRGTVTPHLTVDTVQQEYYSVGRRNKLWALNRILDHEKPDRMLIFCSTKNMVTLLMQHLRKLGFPVEALHGDLTQSRRMRVLERFKQSPAPLLVATDVAARGLDIDDITHVINYDLPDDPTVYVHRIGRTARMGRKGKAISFVSKYDRKQLELVQSVAGGLIELREPPEPSQDDTQRERVRKVIDWEHISDRYGNVHFRIGIGRKQEATMTSLHKLIRSATGIQDYLIGPIQIQEEESLFTIPKEYAMRTLESLRRASHRGKKIVVEIEPQA